MRPPDDWECSYTAHPEDLDRLHAIFVTSDLTVFCSLDELGLVAIGQCLGPDQAVIEYRAAEPDPWCWGGAAAVKACPPRRGRRGGLCMSRSGIG